MANRIHPTAIIADGVELGTDNVVGPYAVLLGPTVIGDGNWIGPHVVVGTPAGNRDAPHVIGWDGEMAGFGVRIGDSNVIRENVTVHGGASRTTRVGDNCILLVNSHVGHDVIVEDKVTLAPAAQIAGHCRIWGHANIGMGATVHQQVHVGPGAMVGMSSAVRKAAAPWSVLLGNPARAVSMNTVGLARLGCDEDMVAAVAAYLSGSAELPAGLPDEVATLLKAWADRGPAQL